MNNLCDTCLLDFNSCGPDECEFEDGHCDEVSFNVIKCSAYVEVKQ